MRERGLGDGEVAQLQSVRGRANFTSFSDPPVAASTGSQHTRAVARAHVVAAKLVRGAGASPAVEHRASKSLGGRERGGWRLQLFNWVLRPGRDGVRKRRLRRGARRCSHGECDGKFGEHGAMSEQVGVQHEKKDTGRAKRKRPAVRG